MGQKCKRLYTNTRNLRTKGNEKKQAFNNDIEKQASQGLGGIPENEWNTAVIRLKLYKNERIACMSGGSGSLH